jgi:hypothetical protein
MGGLAGLAGVGGLSGAAGATGGNGTALQDDGSIDLDVHVTQEEGKAVNWVLPGPRRLSEQVFGTPENPMMGDDLIQHLKNQQPELEPLLDEMPLPYAVPEEMRETNEDGTEYTITSVPTPFGDEHEPTEGYLDLVYKDRQPGVGMQRAADEIDLDIAFTDPAGNVYTLEMDHLLNNMFGGVLNGGSIHGTTGIGSPLMTQLYNYGAFWGVGTLVMNDGEQTWENREIHVMTTQMMRDENYALMLDENMPPDNPYLGRMHHTHGIIPPVESTEEGLRFDPLDIPFPPDADQGQPFIHIMFDQDEVTTQMAE